MKKSNQWSHVDNFILTPPRRSLLFFPGNKPTLFAKAVQAGADMVAADLEDAVAPADKETARQQMMALFAEMGGKHTAENADEPECVLRINTIRTAEGLADLQAILAAPTPPPALMLPKVKSADEVRLYDELLAPHPHVQFHVIIETNEGLEQCHAIARASQRVTSLLFGGVDLAADLRLVPNWEGLLYGRSRVVHAAAAAGIDVLDVPYLHFGDLAGLEVEAEAGKRLGFGGKAAVHPAQIPIINRCFSPTPAQIAEAEQVVAAFAAQGSGVVALDGKVLERPVLRTMHRILAIAGRMK